MTQEESSAKLAALMSTIRRCQLCANALPLGPHPVIRGAATARLLIIGQAPGLKVHHSGIPWSDASGQRLRSWLAMDEATFYDEDKIAIIPMGFCYPGRGKQGDLPPRPECAHLWHPQLLPLYPEIQLTLLIGQYAQAAYLPDGRTLTQRVQGWRDYAPYNIPLPHPSPRNSIWLKRHPWFSQELLPDLQNRIDKLLHNLP